MLFLQASGKLHPLRSPRDMSAQDIPFGYDIFRFAEIFGFYIRKPDISKLLLQKYPALYQVKLSDRRDNQPTISSRALLRMPIDLLSAFFCCLIMVAQLVRLAAASEGISLI